MTEFYHEPVMASEVVEWLECSLTFEKQTIAVDVTLGGGGHAEALLERFGPSLELIGIDRDRDALGFAKKRLERFGRQVKLVHAHMGDIASVLEELGLAKVNAVLADLGVSSFQLDSAGRGFSFMRSGPLDMRMDRTEGETALDLIRRLTEEDLARVIFEFGEERNSRKIARAVKLAQDDIATTEGLANVVAGAFGGFAKRARLHPATRTFQALRIAVNDELDELKRFLKAAPKLLARHGRLAVISYHSLEDRLVKNCFRENMKGEDFKLAFKKMLMAGPNEVRKNPRARGAKLRVLERM